MLTNQEYYDLIEKSEYKNAYEKTIKEIKEKIKNDLLEKIDTSINIYYAEQLGKCSENELNAIEHTIQFMRKLLNDLKNNKI